MSREIEVIGRDGARRTEQDGYVLRDGERLASVRVPMHLMDANAGPGRVVLTDSAPKPIAVGDAVMTDTVNGLERVTFGDRSTALKTQGGWMYFWPNGQQAPRLTRDQQAHQAQATGSTFKQWADAHIEGAGNAIAAHSAYLDHLANAWRG